MAPSSSNASSDPNSLKLALAIALLRFKKLYQNPSSSDPDGQRWKRKAKERKREILRLREEIKQLEDGVQREDVPQIASCRCHFFDNCGEMQTNGEEGVSGGRHWVDEVLRRRFLRLVRWKERRKRLDGATRQRHLIEFDNEDEIQRLGTSIDFLVELSDTASVKGQKGSTFATFSHQATDFILASLKNLLSLQRDSDLIEETINGLIMRLTKRMCGDDSEKEGSLISVSDAQFFVQHLIRKLGNEPFIGQRVMLTISHRISIIAETLLFTDPFDVAFPRMHGSMFLMIQLIEFLISDHMQNWTSYEDFDRRLFEEWARSILQARKSLELLECRNGLYTLYMERVFGELVKQVGPLAHQGKLDLDILSNLLY